MLPKFLENKRELLLRTVVILGLAGMGCILLSETMPERASPENTAMESRLTELLSRMEGVGEAQVLVTEEGAVIVCTGGDSPAVQERVLRAACTACGFPSNQVYIAKLIT